MGKITSKENIHLANDTEHNHTGGSKETDPLLTTNTWIHDKLSVVAINKDGPSTDESDDKLFKSKREMLILLALSLAIFSVTCCESILAPFYAPEVSSTSFSYAEAPE